MLLVAAQSPSQRRMPVVLGSVVVLLLGACAMAAVVWHQVVRVQGPVELAASKPWGIDFDIRYARGKRQWQITNLVLHPPAPPPAAGKAPPMVMTKATFPYYVIRLAGGILYLGGMLIMLYNCLQTIRVGKPVDARVALTVAHA